MTGKVEVTFDPKSNSVEGHTKKCHLNFKGEQIWETGSCHDNTTRIADALNKADYRFTLIIEDKPHSVEGHTALINIKRDGKTYLENHSTHDNMRGLRDAVNKALENDN